MRRSNYEILKKETQNLALVWKRVHGIAPKEVADKMDKAMLEWMVELTNCLALWIDKGKTMSVGELILARVNLGALVEAWLRFFYYVFCVDYWKKPKTKKSGSAIKIEKLEFEDLKTFSIGILWDDVKNKEYLWVDKIQSMRNSIHILQYRDIGNAEDFLKDIEEYYNFVHHILECLPSVEEELDSYPEGYESNVYFD